MTAVGELRVLILPATRRDGLVAVQVLQRAGVGSEFVAEAGAMAEALATPVGALVIADTALARADFGTVLDAIAAQPAWSDLPVVLMSRVGEVSGSERISAVTARLTNVTVIDRPTSVRTLVSAVEAALRARQRQYQIRDQITALREAEEALRLGDRRKDEFLATLAHELRNPLAPLRSALAVLKLRGGADAQQARLLQLMERQISVMVRLIEDLMDLARIASGKVVLQQERLDMRDVIDGAVESAAPAIAAARHQLNITKPSTPAYVMGDATRLIQVVGNLLSNAAKYTPAGGQLLLSLHVSDATVVVEMRDNGVGIPAPMLPHVFDMFAQVNRTLDRAQGGLGIGLSLVRDLLDMHGGSITAASGGVDRGSTFTIQLPRLQDVDQPAASEPDAVPAAHAGERHLRVLVIDDNQDAADALAMLLQAAGHEVWTAYGGAQGVELAEQHRPGVVLCDIGMPGMNGHEVAKALRRDAANSGAVLIALTGWGTQEVKNETAAAGFDFHFTKPVDVDSIAGLLQQL